MPTFLDPSFESRFTVYVDAMFYFNACTNLNRAKEMLETISNVNKKLKTIDSYQDYVAYDLGDEIDPEFTPEDLAEIEHCEEVCSLSYEMFIQSVATTHIFCATALEAHINTKSMDLLHGKLFDQFEKVSLEGKWLMLPKLLGHNSFDPGKQPYQDFTGLIKTRNALVHYKTKSQPWQPIKGPIFKRGSGMSLTDAEKSITTTKNMITELSTMLKERPPWWIAKGNHTYLKIEEKAI